MAQIRELERKLKSASNERNYVQLERDTVQSYYDITKEEVHDCELEILTKEREMEEMQHAHVRNIRVYSQKVKHLEYEHKTDLRESKEKAEGEEEEEKAAHVDRETSLEAERDRLQHQVSEVELANEEDVSALVEAHQKSLSKMRETFDENLDSLREKFDERLDELRKQFELRRKVEVHEIEERKNQHINELMRKHEIAYGQIKTYYNDITHDNLKLIKSLKGEVADMKKKATSNQKLMYDIAQENKRLSEPLQVAVKEVESLKNELKDCDKDKLSLKNAASRLKLLKRRVNTRADEIEALTHKFDTTEHERNRFYDAFHSTIEDLQRKTQVKNVMLERRLAELQQEFEVRS